MAVPLTRGDDRRVGMLMRSPFFKIASVLLRLGYVYQRHRKRESRHDTANFSGAFRALSQGLIY